MVNYFYSYVQYLWANLIAATYATYAQSYNMTLQEFSRKWVGLWSQIDDF